MDAKKSLSNILKASFGIATIGILGFSCFNQTKLQKNSVVNKILQIEDSAQIAYPSLATFNKLKENSKNYNFEKNDYAEIIRNMHNDLLTEIPNIKEERENIDLCYRTSLLGLEILRDKNIPVYAIDIPGEHMFLMIDAKRDGHNFLDKTDPINEGDRNIETTTGEIENLETGKYSDAYYIDQKNISKSSIEKGISMKILGDDDLLAKAYWQRASHYLKEGNSKEAIKDCEKAIELNPKCAQAYQVLGIANATKNFISSHEDHEKAIEAFNKAFEISQNPQMYYLKGRSYAEMHNSEKAIENYSKAINSALGKSDNSMKNLEIKSLYWRMNIYERIGDIENAKKDKEKFNELYAGLSLKTL